MGTSAEASPCHCTALRKASRRIPLPYNQVLVARGVVDACLLAGSTTDACDQCTQPAVRRIRFQPWMPEQ